MRITVRLILSFIVLFGFVWLAPGVVAQVGVNTWNSLGPEGESITVLAIDPSNTNVIYAGADGGIFKTSNGGSSWSAINSGMTGSEVAAVAIDPLINSTVYVGVHRGGLFKSTNGGANWRNITGSLPDISIQSLAIDPFDSNVIYVGTELVGVFRSIDGGANWMPSGAELRNATIYSLKIDPSNPKTIYAGTAEDGMYKTTNRGARWASLDTGFGKAVFSIVIDPSNARTLYAVTTPSGRFNRIPIKSTDGGASWTEMSAGLSGHDVASIVVGNASVLYAGVRRCCSVDRGGVFKSTNGGEFWSLVTDDFDAYSAFAIAIDPLNPNIVYATIDTSPSIFREGRVFKSTNGGVSWFAANSGLTNTFVAALAMAPSNPDVIYAGIDGGVIKSTNRGVTWSKANNGVLDSTITSIVADPTNPNVLYASGVIKSIDGGAHWTYTGNNGRVLGLDPSDPNIIYASSTGVSKSTNGGGSWSSMSGGLPRDSVRTLQLDPSNTSILYAGTDESGLFKSTNGGESWTANNAGLNESEIRAIVIDPSNPNILYAGTSGTTHQRSAGGIFLTYGRVYKSTDAGAHWGEVIMGSIVDNINALAIDPFRTETIYAGTDSHGIWKSSNAGASWTEINVGLTVPFITTLLIDPSDSRTIYAGTDGGGVFRIQLKKPEVLTAVLESRKKLTISGANLGSSSRVIINDTDRTDFVISASDTTILLKGKTKNLSLKSGDNRIQVIAPTGEASDVFVLKL